MIKIIEKLNFTGKWIEVFNKNRTNKDNFDECCKSYMLLEQIELAGLQDYVDVNGYAGLRINWVNGHPDSVSISDSIELSFSDIYKIEYNKHPNKGSWETDSIDFYTKCAEIFASRFHLQQMEYYKNSDVYY